MIAFLLQPVQGILMGKNRKTVRVDPFEGILLFQHVDIRMQAYRQAFLLTEHLQLALRRQAIVGGEVFMPGNLIAKQAQGPVQCLIMPFLGFNQDAVHVKNNCFYHIFNYIENTGIKQDTVQSPRTVRFEYSGKLFFFLSFSELFEIDQCGCLPAGYTFRALR